MPRSVNPSSVSNSQRCRYGPLDARVLQPLPSSIHINRSRFSHQTSEWHYRNGLVFFREWCCTHVQFLRSQSHAAVPEHERRKILFLAAFRSLSFALPLAEKQSSASSEDAALCQYREFLGVKHHQRSYHRYHLAEIPWLSSPSPSSSSSFSSICRNRRNLVPSLRLLESLRQEI